MCSLEHGHDGLHCSVVLVEGVQLLDAFDAVSAMLGTAQFQGAARRYGPDPVGQRPEGPTEVDQDVAVFQHALITGLPAIGVGKTTFIARWACAWSVVGDYGSRSRWSVTSCGHARCEAGFVSVGDRVGWIMPANFVLDLCRGYRLPETI